MLSTTPSRQPTDGDIQFQVAAAMASAMLLSAVILALAAGSTEAAKSQNDANAATYSLHGRDHEYHHDHDHGVSTQS